MYVPRSLTKDQEIARAELWAREFGLMLVDNSPISSLRVRQPNKVSQATCGQTLFLMRVP